MRDVLVFCFLLFQIPLHSNKPTCIKHNLIDPPGTAPEGTFSVQKGTTEKKKAEIAYPWWPLGRYALLLSPIDLAAAAGYLSLGS